MIFLLYGSSLRSVKAMFVIDMTKPSIKDKFHTGVAGQTWRTTAARLSIASILLYACFAMKICRGTTWLVDNVESFKLIVHRGGERILFIWGSIRVLYITLGYILCLCSCFYNRNYRDHYLDMILQPWSPFFCIPFLLLSAPWGTARDRSISYAWSQILTYYILPFTTIAYNITGFTDVLWWSVGTWQNIWYIELKNQNDLQLKLRPVITE